MGVIKAAKINSLQHGGCTMAKRFTALTAIGLALCFTANLAQGEVFVYPKKGQSQDQFEQDQFQCHKWAQQQTGVDPAQPQPAAGAPPQQQGGAVRGAARGAAVGAVGGAIGGDAGKGAAIGAAVGAVGGRMRQNRQNQEAAAAQQQAQGQQQANVQRYEKAYGTCLAGRGYQVR
jgi:hypothetical protein